MAHEPRLTAAEKARVTVLVARMCKRNIAGDAVDLSDLQRKVDRILDGARAREEKAAKQRP
ncbi:hypothetical protein GCM10010420_07340 [Streptomyces glaucosporus]|uniref:Uncharacterized protein n=1 Tax=Streptomyces glaucosporus TaxID=284044 RepID=A0ABN3HSD0_9ACTN